MAAAQAIYTGIYGARTPASISAFLTNAVTSYRGWSLILLGNAVGLVFAVIAFTISVVSFPFLVDRDVGAGVALRTSVDAVVANPGMALWGLIVAVCPVIGSLPLLVGLTVVMLIPGHATWHLYRGRLIRHLWDARPEGREIEQCTSLEYDVNLQSQATSGFQFDEKPRMNSAGRLRS